jgi:DNA mismatch endonuclease (patch repair protein)
MDRVSKEKRSEIMSKVNSKDTNIEVDIRKMLHGLGYRFRLHRKDLPGSPDIVLPKYKKIIFVHGCFWHGHFNCNKARLPKSNIEYWVAKIAANKIRDQKAIEELTKIGWKVLIIWGCQLKDKETLKESIIHFLER